MPERTGPLPLRRLAGSSSSTQRCWNPAEAGLQCAQQPWCKLAQRSEHDDDERCCHRGQATDWQTGVGRGLAVLLGEFLVHGHDIAAAVGRPWRLAPAEAALVCRGVAPLLGAWLAPAAGSAHIAYVLELAVDTPPLILSVSNGQLHPELPTDTSPRVLAVDPVEPALVVIYKAPRARRSAAGSAGRAVRQPIGERAHDLAGPSAGSRPSAAILGARGATRVEVNS
jgi:hypothetical protein